MVSNTGYYVDSQRGSSGAKVMPDVTFNAIASASATDANFIAASVSTNFANIAAVINSNNLNSVNYSASAILSSNVAFNALLSQHVSNNAIIAAKISDSNIEHRHLEFRTKASDTAGSTALNPARVVQLGEAADNVKYARISATHTMKNDIARHSFALQFSDCLDWGGTTPFTATPIFANMPNIAATGPGNSFLVQAVVATVINSVSAGLVYVMQNLSMGAATITNTVHAEVYGK